MKLQYLGTAAAEGWPALFCECDHCKRAKEAGGRNIRTRSQAVIDDTLMYRDACALRSPLSGGYRDANRRLRRCEGR